MLKDGLRADLLMLAYRDVGDESQSECMLSQHRALKDIQSQPRDPAERQPAGPRHSNRPVEYRQYEKRGARRIEPAWHRHHRQKERSSTVKNMRPMGSRIRTFI